MDSQNFERHILRLDAQVQALKGQLAISEQVISQLIFRIQILESGRTDITDPQYIQIQNSISSLRTIRPLKQRADV